MHIGVFSTKKTARLSYLLDFVFGIFFDTSYILTDDLNEFKAFEGLKIAYSKEKIEDCVWIEANELLFQDHIKEQNTLVEVLKGRPLIFQTRNENSFCVDIFSLAFFMLSRYEEYLDFTPDHFGRFSGQNSLAFQHKFHQFPIVDYWLIEFKKYIEKQYPNQILSLKPVEACIPTIDIDHPWEIKHLPFVIQIGKISRSLLSFKWVRAISLIQSAFFFTKDAFDSYSSIISAISTNISAKIFVLLRFAKFPDQNRHLYHPAFKKLLQDLSHHFELGIHPSVNSSDNIEKLSEEVIQFKKLRGDTPNISRQHYLVLKFPYTYRALIDQGIKKDYSMGYHDICGFRAGTSRAFYWYDLVKEEPTELMVQPFLWMDVSLQKYLRLTPRDAINTIANIKEEVKITQGSVSFIWHNSSFDMKSDWKDWDEVFRESLKV